MYPETYEPLPLSQPLFSRRLRPHRSLTRRSSHIVLLIFAGVSFFSSLPFIFMGAWPVAGFMGLDAVLLAYAFKLNFRAARAYEDVSLTVLELFLAKVDPAGKRAEWRFNPLWVRFEQEAHEEFGMQRLAIVSRGRSVEVAQFLGPDEKAEFAGDFSRALTTAKRGPRYS